MESSHGVGQESLRCVATIHSLKVWHLSGSAFCMHAYIILYYRKVCLTKAASPRFGISCS